MSTFSKRSNSQRATPSVTMQIVSLLFQFCNPPPPRPALTSKFIFNEIVPVPSSLFKSALLFVSIRAHTFSLGFSVAILFYRWFRPHLLSLCSLIQIVSGTLFLFPAYILLTYPASMIPVSGGASAHGSASPFSTGFPMPP